MKNPIILSFYNYTKAKFGLSTMEKVNLFGRGAGIFRKTAKKALR